MNSPVVVLVLLAGGVGALVVMWIIGAARGNGRPVRGARLNNDFDDDDDVTYNSSSDVSALLLQMADRYENSGDMSAASAAREAAERAGAAADVDSARQAADDYLSSVNAGAVIEAFSVADVSGSSSSDSSSFDSSSSNSSDGGSNFSDNS